MAGARHAECYLVLRRHWLQDALSNVAADPTQSNIILSARWLEHRIGSKVLGMQQGQGLYSLFAIDGNLTVKQITQRGKFIYALMLSLILAQDDLEIERLIYVAFQRASELVCAFLCIGILTLTVCVVYIWGHNRGRGIPRAPLHLHACLLLLPPCLKKYILGYTHTFSRFVQLLARWKLCCCRKFFAVANSLPRSLCWVETRFKNIIIGWMLAYIFDPPPPNLNQPGQGGVTYFVDLPVLIYVETMYQYHPFLDIKSPTIHLPAVTLQIVSLDSSRTDPR